jgi:hypothetical protein
LTANKSLTRRNKYQQNVRVSNKVPKTVNLALNVLCSQMLHAAENESKNW